MESEVTPAEDKVDTLGPVRQWDLVATTKTTPRTTQELLVLVKVTQSEVSLVLRHHILLNNLVVVILHSNLVVILHSNLVVILLNRLVDMEDPRVVIQVAILCIHQTISLPVPGDFIRIKAEDCTD